MKTFVITYKELINGKIYPYETLWHGENFEDALKSFYGSWDKDYAKKVSEVRIYDLIEIILPEEVQGEIRR